MLNSLVSRLNRDENEQMKRNVFSSCSLERTPDSRIIRYSHINSNNITPSDIKELKTKLDLVSFDNTQPFEMNASKLVSAVNESVETLTEAAQKKKTCVTIEKEKYTEVMDMIKKYSLAKPDDKKGYEKTLKSYINSLLAEEYDMDDNRPVDAFNQAIINKLYRLYGCTEKIDPKLTQKEKVIAKIQAIHSKQKKTNK